MRHRGQSCKLKRKRGSVPRLVPLTALYNLNGDCFLLITIQTCTVGINHADYYMGSCLRFNTVNWYHAVVSFFYVIVKLLFGQRRILLPNTHLKHTQSTGTLSLNQTLEESQHVRNNIHDVTNIEIWRDNCVYDGVLNDKEIRSIFVSANRTVSMMHHLWKCM